MIVPVERRGGFQLWEGFESGFLLHDPWLHGTRLAEPQQFRGYQSDVLAQRAAEWMAPGAPRPAGQPYFCVVSLEAPHPPYHAPAPHATAMDPAEVKLRPNVPLHGPVETQARTELAGYYAHIEATDRSVGRLLAETDLTETIVVFTSVHGDMHGSHGVFRKAWPYEESIRVPLLVRGLQAEDRARVDASPVSLVDLPHLAVAWADGKAWHCRRDHAAISMPVAAALPRQCERAWRGFRSGRHKLVLNADGSPWLYFDLERDPWELNNLAGDPARAKDIAELRALL
jgi:arylsulfatase A-like enzyme